MKKERTKGFLAGIITATLIFSLAVPAIAATVRQLNATFSGIQITLDGKTVTPKDAKGNPVEPFAVDGTTYLPVRAVADALGLGVNWDQTTQTVALTSGNHVAPTSTILWDATHTAASLGYKVPSAWTPVQGENTISFYAEKSLAPRSGFLQVVTDSLETSIDDQQLAEVFLKSFADILAAKPLYSRNFVAGAVTPLSSGGYTMTCAYDFILSESETFPTRTIVVVNGKDVITFTLCIPATHTPTIEACAAALIDTFVTLPPPTAASYADRLAAVAARSIKGEKITYSKYLSIRDGMSYIEVAELIGDLGERSVESGDIVIRQWESSKGGFASITFTNNKVTAMAQVGL